MTSSHERALRSLRLVVDVTVIIPSLPSRGLMLQQARTSVYGQTVQPSMILERQALPRENAASVRNKCLNDVKTEWVAFLDDDDILYRDHIRFCLQHAVTTGADLVYPWFDVLVDNEIRNDLDPLAAPHRGSLRSPYRLPFGDEQADHLRSSNFIPVTVLAKTDAVRSVGGFPETQDHEDWGLWRAMLDNGATFAHLPVRTWAWRWHDRQTKGDLGRNGFTTSTVLG